MNLLNYPRSKNADICLILEGTYPFVKGGVSNWVYELIRVFPHYRFAVIFLGTREEDYHGLCYPLLENVVHLEAHFLFEKKPALEYSNTAVDKETMETIKIMHERFSTFTLDKSNAIPEVFDLMDMTTNKINEELFFRSPSAWQFIISKYKERYSDQSFFDFFWGVRNLHRPFWILAKIAEHIPTVKLLHSASTGYAGFLGALLQNKYCIPYILTEHGIYTKERWIEIMRSYFFEYLIRENSQIKNESGVLVLWMRFFSILAKISYIAANPIISLFEEYRQRQIAGGASPEKTKIISYGIDFEHYKFLNKNKPNQNKPVIACIGRVVPIKDVKTFIRASALIIKKNPAAEAWIIGSIKDDPDYVDTCKNLIEMLDLKERIKLLGVQNVMDIFPKIDLLISSSISEGSPFVILESFAVGIPVIATDVGGCRELIYGKNKEDQSHGKAGELVSIADPDALASAAFKLLTDDNAWSKAQQVALARIRKYYSMEKLIENYSAIYEEAISHGRNRV